MNLKPADMALVVIILVPVLLVLSGFNLKMILTALGLFLLYILILFFEPIRFHFRQWLRDRTSGRSRRQPDER